MLFDLEMMKIKLNQYRWSFDQIARIRPIYYFPYEGEVQSLDFDSQSSKVVRIEFDNPNVITTKSTNFTFTPNKVIRDVNDRRIIVVLEAYIPINPFLEDIDQPNEKDKYFSLPKAEILMNEVVLVEVEQSKTKYSRKSPIEISRLVMLVSCGFSGTVIHRPKPKLTPQLRRILVGNWSPETSKYFYRLSPEVSIVSNEALIR